ncbi:MAG TPA: hypothetical protein PK781_10340 [Terrimesophilobacter sp.]|nr:hypothetical protein [Terrimesophilobacter sp.]HRQ00840.1 hypothetical protein [Terrimesophilobacter sp.]
MRRKLVRTMTVAILGAALVATASIPSAAIDIPWDQWRPVWPGNADVRVWKGKDNPGPKVIPSKYNHGCTVTLGRYTVREFGVSGVSRFKFRYELRGYYDEGYLFLPTHANTQWFYSKAFSDDERSFWVPMYLPAGHLNMIPTNGSTYKLWLRVVGMRSGMADVRKNIEVGPVSCTYENSNNSGVGQWPGGGGRPYS